MNKDYKFRIQNTGKCVQGTIIYKEYEKNDCGFTFKEQDVINEDIFGLYIGYTKLVFSVKLKKAIWFGGWNNYHHWLKAPLELPQSVKGELYIDYELDNTDERYAENWPVHYEIEQNLICMGDYNTSEDDTAVEFCTDIIAVLQDQCLKAIWIKNCKFINVSL